MDHRWTHLISDLRERFTPDADIVEVEAWLSSQGYDRRQIGEILAILYRDSIPGSAIPTGFGDPVQQRNAPLRVQGPHERGRFSPEAWGYLVILGGSGLVTMQDFEQLVERALVHVDGRIGLAEIRAIAEDGGFDDAVASSDRSLVH